VLETFTLATFTPLVGARFRVTATAGVLELALVEARSRGADGNPFSLVFKGPPAPLLPQATYRFEHAGLGAFDLFICPIAAPAEGVRYEAVFNRLPPKASAP
jgi:hypothetical protein